MMSHGHGSVPNHDDDDDEEKGNYYLIRKFTVNFWIASKRSVAIANMLQFRYWPYGNYSTGILFLNEGNHFNN